MSKILQVEHLVQEFNLTKDFLDKVKFKKGRFSLEHQVVHSVNDVSFDVEQAGRGVQPGGRVRMRQIHHGTYGHQAHRAKGGQDHV